MSVARTTVRLLHFVTISGLALGVTVVSTPSRPPLRDAAESRIADLVEHERFVEAFSLGVARARELAERQDPLAPETIAALERVGTIAYDSGALDIAGRILRLTIELRRETTGPDSLELAESLLRWGRVARVAADLPGATASYDRALEIVEPRAVERPGLYADLLAARASRIRGADLDAAIAGYERAVDARRSDPTAGPIEIADDLTWLGWSMLHRGRHADALRVFDRAETVLRAARRTDHSLFGVIVSARADAAAIRGDWAEAERLYRTSTAVFDRVRSGCFPGFARVKIPRHGYSELALAVLHQGRESEAFELLERGRGAVTQEFLDLGGSSDAAAIRAAWIEADRAGRESGLDRAEEVRRLLLGLDRYTRLMEVEHGLIDRDGPPRRRLADVQAALRPNEAYVGWEPVSLGDQHGAATGPVRHETWAFVVRPAGLRWIPLLSTTSAGSRPLRAEVDLYVGRMQRAAAWPLRVDPDPELLELGRELARALVEPVTAHLDGVDRLVVELSDLVPFLPVESLPLSDGTCLKEHVSVAYVPSAAAYLDWKARGSRDDVTARPALAVGDPGLPFAAREAANIAGLFPQATVLQEPAATADVLAALASADRLREFGVVHVAAHVISPWIHDRAAVRLGDRRIELTEILAGWRLDADLVTLSGCRSMSGHVFPERGEYLGLPQALFAAGARAVVASTWEVDDEAASLLMQRFYENLTGRPRVSPVEALREAGLWLRDYRDETGARPFEHPVYWSGFVVLGASE